MSNKAVFDRPYYINNLEEQLEERDNILGQLFWDTPLILRLHYVPGDHGSHGSPKRSAPCNLVNFCLGTKVLLSIITFRHGLSRYPLQTVTNRGLNPRRHDGALRLSSRYVTDACTFPHGLSRCDGTSHVSLLY